LKMNGSLWKTAESALIICGQRAFFRQILKKKILI